jgi:hypothetical protein
MNKAHKQYRRWKSTGGIETRLQAGLSEVQIPEETRGFLLSITSRPALGPTSLLFNWLFLLGIKGLGCKADHSPLSSAEVKDKHSLCF